SGEHDRWLRGLRFEGALAVCFDEGYGGVLQAKARRDRLDQAIFDAATLPARRLDTRGARADGRARRLAALRTSEPRRVPRPRPERALERRPPPAGRD